MDLVTLISLCSLATSPQVDDLAHRVALSNDADVFRVDDMTEGSAYNPNTVSEAKGMTLALLEKGHDVRVGLLLVPARSAVEEFGWGVEKLFEACANVSIGTELLQQARRKSRNPHKLLSYYLFGNRTDGLDWADHVLTFNPMGTLEGRRGPSPVFQVDTPTLFAIENEAPKASENTLEKKKAPKVSPNTPAKSSAVRSKPSKRSRKSATHQTKFVPQQDVTSERLQTSNDLSRGTK